MMFTVVWRTVLAVLLLITAASWAQQTPDSGVSTAGTPATGAPTAGMPATGTPAAGKETPAPEAESGLNNEPEVTEAASEAEPPPGETAGEPGPVTPPGEYRASEQISDDLSVSFPVDI
jgi:hypothetical protein